MIHADFRPKNDKKVCENCIHFEECPVDYVCPTLDRIYTEELLEKILEEQDE